MRDIDRNINSQLYNKEPEIKEIFNQKIKMNVGEKSVSATLTNVKFKNKLYYAKVSCPKQFTDMTKITIYSGFTVLSVIFLSPQIGTSVNLTTGIIISDKEYAPINVLIEKTTAIADSIAEFTLQIYEEL